MEYEVFKDQYVKDVVDGSLQKMHHNADSNQINYLEFKVSKLANRINKIEDNLEIVTDFMMEVLSVEEIE